MSFKDQTALLNAAAEGTSCGLWMRVLSPHLSSLVLIDLAMDQLIRADILSLLEAMTAIQVGLRYINLLAFKLTQHKDAGSLQSHP